MANVTYFVAMPFDRGEDGELVAGEAQERQSASAAESAARRMAATATGAVAFSRTGDHSDGEFEDAVVLRSSAKCRASTRRISAKEMERQLIAAARVSPSDCNSIPPVP